ncbi:MAG: hypothetical protein AAFV53_43870 [Myxococcota bacterium]
MLNDLGEFAVIGVCHGALQEERRDLKGRDLDAFFFEGFREALEMLQRRGGQRKEAALSLLRIGLPAAASWRLEARLHIGSKLSGAEVPTAGVHGSLPRHLRNGRPRAPACIAQYLEKKTHYSVLNRSGKRGARCQHRIPPIP